MHEYRMTSGGLPPIYVMESTGAQTAAGLIGGGPKCFCGSQATKRIGESALMRQCQRCGKTMMWRLRDGEFKAMPIHFAAALDKRRAA